MDRPAIAEDQLLCRQAGYLRTDLPLSAIRHHCTLYPAVSSVSFVSIGLERLAIHQAFALQSGTHEIFKNPSYSWSQPPVQVYFPTPHISSSVSDRFYYFIYFLLQIVAFSQWFTSDCSVLPYFLPIPQSILSGLLSHFFIRNPRQAVCLQFLYLDLPILQ